MQLLDSYSNLESCQEIYCELFSAVEFEICYFAHENEYFFSIMFFLLCEICVFFENWFCMIRMPLHR